MPVPILRALVQLAADSIARVPVASIPAASLPSIGPRLDTTTVPLAPITPAVQALASPTVLGFSPFTAIVLGLMLYFTIDAILKSLRRAQLMVSVGVETIPVWRYLGVFLAVMFMQAWTSAYLDVTSRYGISANIGPVFWTTTLGIVMLFWFAGDLNDAQHEAERLAAERETRASLERATRGDGQSTVDSHHPGA